MSTTRNLLADLLARELELETNGSQLRWRPDCLVNAPLRNQILTHREELIRLLLSGESDGLPRCPTCDRFLDSKKRCTKCWDRLCVDCEKLTGTYYVMRCVICGYRWVQKEKVNESQN